MRGQSPVVLGHEEVAAPAAAPLRWGEEERQREAGLGVRAAGVARCVATLDRAEPELLRHWSPAGPSTYCSSGPLLGAPGRRPDGGFVNLAVTLTR